MSEPKDYGEPWEAESRGGYIENRHSETVVYDEGAPTNDEANRIVSCVNACQGIADPSAEIARLRADVARLENAIREFTQSPGRDARVLFAALTDTADKQGEQT